MALVLGTNCGFVTTAPTSDPEGTNIQSSYANSIRVTAPIGAIKITEIGWYCDNATQESNFEVGLYSDDGTNYPNARLNVDNTNAKGTTAGWKRVTVDWAITAETIYWIAVRVDITTPTTSTNYGSIAGAIRAFYSGTSLTNPWTDYSYNSNIAVAIYAVWEAAPSGTNTQINTGDTWKEISAAQINIGDTWKAVAGMQVNIGDTWKAVF